MQVNSLSAANIAIRLDDVIKNLKLGKRWKGESSKKAVIEACMEQVDHLLDNLQPQGEAFAARAAQDLQIRFEEVHGEKDIKLLERVYLHEKREPGFALLRREIQSQDVDALLFQRRNADLSAPDRWVAVLNMTHTKDRAYWNKFHEMAHRLAEPPQKLLPFRRQLNSDLDELEKLMDAIAGNLAFHNRIFAPHFTGLQKHSPLTFDMVKNIREAYAPSASLLSVTNAAVQLWDAPAMAFVAREKQKKNGPQDEKSLRVEPQAKNALALKNGLFLIPNMRIPESSCTYHTFFTGFPGNDKENLGNWTTSTGSKLPAVNVFISAIKLDSRVYGIITML